MKNKIQNKIPVRQKYAKQKCIKIKQKQKHGSPFSIGQLLLDIDLPCILIDKLTNSLLEKSDFSFSLNISNPNSFFFLMGWDFVSTSSQYWDFVWFKPVQILHVLPVFLDFICESVFLCLVLTISLESSTTSDSYKGKDILFAHLFNYLEKGKCFNYLKFLLYI